MITNRIINVLSTIHPLRIVVCFWLIAKIWSYKLWMIWRLYPVLPPFDLLEHIPAWFHACLFLNSCLLLLLVLVKPSDKRLVLLLVINELVSCILDQNRWQPWQYMYILIATNFLLVKQPRHMLLIILASIYWYSGLHKLNHNFVEHIWLQWLHADAWKAGLKQWGTISGYLAACIEFIAGLGLLFVRTRKIATFTLLIMHVFILFMIGPLGKHTNTIVWPWNIAMMLLLMSLISDESSIKATFFKSVYTCVMIIPVCILPALSFFNAWDSYLSFSLYSGKVPRAYLCVERINEVPELKRYAAKSDRLNKCKGTTFIALNKWCMSELKVAYYPETRAFNQLQQKLILINPDAGITLNYRNE
jgi:uncharacterized membrane protein YphA (DoxX/SURF4 family)